MHGTTPAGPQAISTVTDDAAQETIPQILEHIKADLADAESAGEILEARSRAKAAEAYAHAEKLGNRMVGECLKMVKRAEICFVEAVDKGIENQELQGVGRPNKLSGIQGNKMSGTLSGEFSGPAKQSEIVDFPSRQRLSEMRKVRDLGEKGVDAVINHAVNSGKRPTGHMVDQAARHGGIVTTTRKRTSDPEPARFDVHMKYFLFDPHAFLNEPRLSCCSLSAGGIWMNLLCLMALSEERGFLIYQGKPYTLTKLTESINAECTEEEVLSGLEELERAGVFNVDSRGVIYSRRMVRDTKKYVQNAPDAAAHRKNGPGDVRDLSGNQNQQKQGHPDFSPVKKRESLILKNKGKRPSEEKDLFGKKKTTDRRKPAKAIPENYPDLGFKAYGRELAKKAGVTVDWEYEAEQFRDYHLQKDTRSRDWPASGRTWARNAVKWAKERGEKDRQRMNGSQPKADFSSIEAAAARTAARYGGV